jgi:hypothetical protein
MLLKGSPTKKALQNNHFYDLRTIKKPIRTLQSIEFKKALQQIFLKILELYSNHKTIDIRLQHNFHIIRKAWLLYSTQYFPDNIWKSASNSVGNSNINQYSTKTYGCSFYNRATILFTQCLQYTMHPLYSSILWFIQIFIPVTSYAAN